MRRAGVVAGNCGPGEGSQPQSAGVRHPRAEQNPCAGQRLLSKIYGIVGKTGAFAWLLLLGELP